MITPRSSGAHFPIPRPTGDMARLNMHKKGVRITVNAGIHKGKIGTIKKVNLMRHSVVFEDGNAGLVQRSYCSFLEYPDSHVGSNIARDASRRMSRLSNQDAEAQPSVRSTVAATNRQLGTEVPRSPQHAIVLDTMNSTNAWKESMEQELGQINGMVSVDSSSIESYHGNEVTSQVLMDLLAQSIASMHLKDAQIDEFARQLRIRVDHFRSGSP
jgi:hypothetical protein